MGQVYLVKWARFVRSNRLNIRVDGHNLKTVLTTGFSLPAPKALVLVYRGCGQMGHT